MQQPLLDTISKDEEAIAIDPIHSEGLTTEQAQQRLKQYGYRPNLVTDKQSIHLFLLSIDIIIPGYSCGPILMIEPIPIHSPIESSEVNNVTSVSNVKIVIVTRYFFCAMLHTYQHRHLLNIFVLQLYHIQLIQQ